MSREPTQSTPPRVHVLPDELANKIAAGEVVERPASVVKELVENALDAHSTRVRVEIEDGGKRLIRVVDDGWGMSRDDALLALERHATSKLRLADDLFAIRTLGFRGEAVPSIASVSRFTIETKPHDQVAGTRIEVEGGVVRRVVDAGCPAGTRVEVRSLFFNTPARRKFLRTRATEQSHIAEILTRLALGQPGVALSLQQDGRPILRAPGEGDQRARIASLLGRDTVDHLYEVSEENEWVRIEGFVGSPTLHQSSARNVYTYVNGRFVRDRLLQHAVMAAYRTVMEKGRFPTVILYLQLPPDQVDVNVHPQKLEVRLSHGQRVHDTIVAALAKLLRAEPWVQAARGYTLRTAEPVAEEAVAPLPEPAAAEDGYQEHRQRIREAIARYRPTQRGAPLPSFPPRPVAAPRSIPQTPEPAVPEPPRDQLALLGETGRFAALEVIGQLWGTYLLCRSADRLVVIDQHAAHERVTFETLRGAFAARKVEVQQMLFPQRLELTAAEAALVEEYQGRLAQLGFELDPFGGRSFMLKAVPAALGEADPGALVRDLLEELRSVTRSTDSFEQVVDAVYSRVACHASVRAGDGMRPEEIRALLARMDHVDFSAHCPHGRPVVAEFTRREVEKWFHRHRA